MLQRTALVLCCLLLPTTSSPLYPALRFGQRAAAILMTSSIEDPLQLPADPSSQTPNAEFRSERHADAIFTNSYRKVLGQISARKFLQTVMGKRLGTETQQYVKRQSGIYGDSFKQNVDMDVIERKQSYRQPQRFKKTIFPYTDINSVCLESLPQEKEPLTIYTLLKIHKNINYIYIYTSENAERG